MSCGKIEIYKKKDWADDFAFVYIRLMLWVNGKWFTEFYAEEAFLIPLGLISQGFQWSQGQTVDEYTQDTYPGLSDALDGTDGVSGLGCSPFDLKPGTRSKCNPSQFSPIVPYVLAELWVWTDQGWCFQAARRNW